MMYCGVLLMVCSAQIAFGAATTKAAEYIPIKYPGPIQDISNRYGTTERIASEVPDSCKNLTYCHIKPSDYPQEHFNKMFKGTKPIMQPSLVIQTIDDRQGDPDDLNDCGTDVSYEPLFKVRTDAGWRTVIQAPEENYVQLVRLETCENTVSPCFKEMIPTPGIETFCRQRYSLWKFLVATDDNGSESVQVTLPTCCGCYYRHV